MRDRILAVTALTCLSTSAMAVPIDFQVGYDVDANDSDPGLVIQTLGLESNPFDFILDIDGQTTYETDLFRIWTDEEYVNWEDDLEQLPIALEFTFLLPEVGSVTGTGETGGANILIASWGYLDWDQSSWNFNFGNGGALQVSLFDATFNGGIFFDDWDNDLSEGFQHGTNVGAKFELLQAPSVAVPEPGTLFLIGSGLMGFGLMRRRRDRA